ncbi:MAG: hypothetical protein QXH20_02780 [Candidatus Bathyarchaeia archaeon]
MQITWLRFNDQISFNMPNVWFCLGIRGSGKSSLLEHIAENYLAKGHAVLDLFGSRDGEGLAWLRNPMVKDKKVLLLKGDSVEVENCSYPVVSVSQFDNETLEDYDVIISASPLYKNLDEEYECAARITDLLYRRISHKRLIYVVCREAANLYYSRLRVSNSQTLAKAQMIYLIRESRHMGLALGLDSIRFYAIDIDVRNLTDYLLLKSQGMQGLTKDLRWLYSYIDPYTFQEFPKKYFIILTKKGSIGFGEFPFPEWHKREGENLVRQFGWKITYKETPQEALDRGTYKTVSDKEHAAIIYMYAKDGYGMQDIASQFNRSLRTIAVHINKHNSEVMQQGKCEACSRAESELAGLKVTRGCYKASSVS